MFTVIGLALKLFFSRILKLVGVVFAWLMKHPAMLCLVIGLALGFACGWIGTQKIAEAKVNKMERKLQDISDQAKKEADRIKVDSTAKADELEGRIVELKEQLVGTVTEYEERLKMALKSERVKIVKVTVPGKTETVDVTFENGKNVCRTYPSAYKEQMDDLVRKAEEELK